MTDTTPQICAGQWNMGRDGMLACNRVATRGKFCSVHAVREEDGPIEERLSRGIYTPASEGGGS